MLTLIWPIRSANDITQHVINFAELNGICYLTCVGAKFQLHEVNNCMDSQNLIGAYTPHVDFYDLRGDILDAMKMGNDEVRRGDA